MFFKRIPLIAVLLVAGSATSPLLAGPWEDTITLSRPVQYLKLPNYSVQKSSPLEKTDGMPASLRAKVARYQAKAKSQMSGDGTIYTEKDVISRSSGNALQRTCVQEVASNTFATTPGVPGATKGKGDQIVVLRGDVINICN
ncbi:MAG: hypothetical protein QMB72_00545 [Brachymonas denitrificans]|jgi:hypothetical protein|uniref:hypothetical protein n=1 Tax=Brachymonas denitrificans TaxID=28220 RepID=UPI001BCE35CA|nr:hypothetical protein [Brachymonas denitrificans]